MHSFSLNISPEHIEQHGSFENYLAAKLEIAKALEASSKRPRIIIANADDKGHGKFLEIDAEVKKTFTLKQAEPYMFDQFGLYLTYEHKNMRSHLARHI
jgi:UDP-N-acetylmuramoylalanine-D-glutamate ligase